MHFEPDNIYHIYNRGNDKTRLFFSPANYLYLLKKVKTEWLPYSDIFCYCLMPTHFHFMLQPKTVGCEYLILKDQLSHLQNLSKVIGKTLSSYTQAINKQHKTTGNLFQKKTRAKCLTDISKKSSYTNQDYVFTCFEYIHSNPLKAGLVDDLKDWQYSSWPDYYQSRKGSLCNMKIAIERMKLTRLEINLLE